MKYELWDGIVFDFCNASHDTTANVNEILQLNWNEDLFAHFNVRRSRSTQPPCFSLSLRMSVCRHLWYGNVIEGTRMLLESWKRWQTNAEKSAQPRKTVNPHREPVNSNNNNKRHNEIKKNKHEFVLNFMLSFLSWLWSHLRISYGWMLSHLLRSLLLIHFCCTDRRQFGSLFVFFFFFFFSQIEIRSCFALLWITPTDASNEWQNKANWKRHGKRTSESSRSAWNTAYADAKIQFTKRVSL